MNRKIFAVILELALIFSLLSITTAATQYSDVPNNWAEKAISKWSDLGILTGSDGKFRPEDPITRGELAVVLDRIMKYQTIAANSFNDLDQAYYTDAILRASAAGVLSGDGAAVRPTALLTKEEAVVLLGKALGLKECTAASGFADNATISSWTVGYINAMTEKGFIQGYRGAFNPQSSITRAEVVAILDRAIIRLFSEPSEYTGNVAGTAIINTTGVVLKDMTINGDLLISEGVGSGDVTLKNVTVTGNTIVRGGGQNSIHIQGTSRLGNLIIEKTDDGQLRIVTEDGAVVDALYLDDGNDDIILTGSFISITISADVTVRVLAADIDTMTINADKAVLDIDKSSSVGTLTLDSAIEVYNGGVIKKALVNLDGVIIDGNAPAEVVTATGVQEVKDTGTGGAGPSQGGGDTGGQTETEQPSSLLPGPNYIMDGNNIILYTDKLDEGKLTSGLYYWSGEYLYADGKTMKTVSGGLTGSGFVINFMIQGLDSGSKYLKFRICERSSQDTNQMTPVTDYSKKLKVEVKDISPSCTVGYEPEMQIVTVTRIEKFAQSHLYLLSYTAGDQVCGAVFKNASATQVTFSAEIGAAPDEFTFIEILDLSIDNEGEATLEMTREFIDAHDS